MRALVETRDRSLGLTRDIAAVYFPDDQTRQDVAERYLRVNINYRFGPEERAGLERFYQYAAELGVVPQAAAPAFFDEPR